jgi:hypothetical protein
MGNGCFSLLGELSSRLVVVPVLLLLGLPFHRSHIRGDGDNDPLRRSIDVVVVELAEIKERQHARLVTKPPTDTTGKSHNKAARTVGRGIGGEERREVNAKRSGWCW